MPYASARAGIEHRLPWYSVYCLTVDGNLLMSTLSRLMYWLRSIHAPDEQNLPTMSVEYDSPTSGPCPAPMAWVIFSSSWPDFTVTWIFGCAAWKSLTTCCRTSASRSVNGFQNSIAPDASTPGVATVCFLGAGVQPAAASSTAAEASPNTTTVRAPVRER